MGAGGNTPQSVSEAVRSEPRVSQSESSQQSVYIVLSLCLVDLMAISGLIWGVGDTVTLGAVATTVSGALAGALSPLGKR